MDFKGYEGVEAFLKGQKTSTDKTSKSKRSSFFFKVRLYLYIIFSVFFFFLRAQEAFDTSYIFFVFQQIPTLVSSHRVSHSHVSYLCCIARGYLSTGAWGPANAQTQRVLTGATY